jgi:hypothetical protein
VGQLMGDGAGPPGRRGLFPLGVGRGRRRAHHDRFDSSGSHRVSQKKLESRLPLPDRALYFKMVYSRHEIL